jgi:hypothetical protein
MTERAPRLLAAGLIALALLAAGIPRPWFVDDAYISFRFADNLAHGRGLVFNPGERVFGLTTPLYGLLLAGAIAIQVPVEIASRAVAGISAAALILALMSLSRSVFKSPWQGLLAGVLLLTNPVFLFNGISGMETNLFLALWAWAFALQARGRIGSAMLLAALSFWCRLEGGMVLAVILAAALLFRENRPAWPRWLPGIFLAALYPVSAWLYYGRVLPQSAARKLATSSAGLAGAKQILGLFEKAFYGQVTYWYHLETAFWILKPFLILGLIGILRAPAKKWTPLAAGTALYLLVYIFSGRTLVQHFPWYFLPPLPALYFLTADGFFFILTLLARGRLWLESRPALFPTLAAWAGRARLCSPRPAFFPIALALGWLLLQLPLLVETGEQRTVNANTRERVYAAAAAWADQVLPAGEMIASEEIGTLGYFSRRKVLDLFGLVSTEQLDATEAVRKNRPALLLLRDRFTDQETLARALPRACRWQKWRRLWIGVRADLSLRVSPAELERCYRAVPIWGRED